MGERLLRVGGNVSNMIWMPAGILMFTIAQALPQEYVWERLASYGALGIICAYLLWERWHDRKREANERKSERVVREDATAAMSAQTAAIDRNSHRMKHLTRLLYIVLNSGQGSKDRAMMLDAISDPEKDTPSAHTPRTPPRDRAAGRDRATDHDRATDRDTDC